MVPACRGTRGDDRALLITVCVTNFNYAAYVGAAIESVLAQDHPEVRLVVVDDGSTDDSHAVLARYSDRAVVVRKDNGGQASAVNLGFSLAEGEAVLFLDADDVLLPGALSRFAAAFRDDPEVVKVSARLRVIDADGAPTGAILPPAPWRLPRGDLRDHVLTRRSYVWPASSGTCYRVDALERILPVPEPEFRIEADLYLASLIVLCGPVGAIDQPLVGYRVHGANAYARQPPDAAHFRSKLARMDLLHDLVRRWITVNEGWDWDPAVEDLDDPAYLAYRMSSAVLAPDEHPYPDDSWRALARRGALAAALHPGHPLLSRIKRAAWFAGVAAAPARTAVGLIDRRYRS